MTRYGTRVWAVIDDDLLGRLDEFAAGKPRGHSIERILAEKFSLSSEAIVLELEPELLGQLREIAKQEHRTVEGQIEWILENWLRGVSHANP